MKNVLLEGNNVAILDDEQEGILWLQFSSGNQKYAFNCCVCYIPPSGSSIGVDLADFYDTLMYQVHLYCKDIHMWGLQWSYW